ncbi:hypothetical protein AB685_06170 [Bacillus sp. LL01]|uniref:YwqH-like family protein n=1 Tax=Bacillus sp. LL01 TaxID=1665556 RepID=UPI00064CFA3C|nr:DUF5082 family protein [Bacillus sp. LL01]KMJ60391.1 hypothetical protein AB685_06170 [Bacillus sp. LL01]
MSIAYYNALLREKQLHLQRLQSCQSQLRGKQQEFASFRASVTRPDLSSFTWQGTLANRFEDIRTNGMLHYFNDMEQSQFSAIFSGIEIKIQQLHREISSIKQTIASLELQLAEEQAAKRFN